MSENLDLAAADRVVREAPQGRGHPHRPATHAASHGRRSRSGSRWQAADRLQGSGAANGSV